MAVDLAKLKISLKIDDDDTDDDGLLQTYLDAAESYVKDAIGDPIQKDDGSTFFGDPDVTKLVDVTVIAIASGYYKAPAAVSLVNLVPVDLVSNSLIGQLRGRYLVWNAGDDDGN